MEGSSAFKLSISLLNTLIGGNTWRKRTLGLPKKRKMQVPRVFIKYYFEMCNLNHILLIN